MGKTKRSTTPGTMNCEKCGALISLRFPVHVCTPKRPQCRDCYGDVRGDVDTVVLCSLHALAPEMVDFIAGLSKLGTRHFEKNAPEIRDEARTLLARLR